MSLSAPPERGSRRRFMKHSSRTTSPLRLRRIINGTPIWELGDVWKEFEKTGEDFYVVKFMGNERSMIIESKAAHARQAEILKKYDIPAATMMEGK